MSMTGTVKMAQQRAHPKRSACQKRTHYQQKQRSRKAVWSHSVRLDDRILDTNHENQRQAGKPERVTEQLIERFVPPFRCQPITFIG